MTAAPAFLYIMRHAEAVPAYGNDRERALTDKGRQDSGYTGQKFMASGFRLPDRALVSPAARARETANCLGLVPLSAIEIIFSLYHGDEQTYLDEICKQDVSSLLIIGHNPSVLQLLHLICRVDLSSAPLPFSFPTASLAVVELSVPVHLCGPHLGRLKAFLTP